MSHFMQANQPTLDQQIDVVRHHIMDAVAILSSHLMDAVKGGEHQAFDAAWEALQVELGRILAAEHQARHLENVALEYRQDLYK